jgi:hypothetical protein
MQTAIHLDRFIRRYAVTFSERSLPRLLIRLFTGFFYTFFSGFFPRLFAGLILLFSSGLLAERVYLKNGTFVDGTIIQQSRTAMQIRKPDGTVITVQKEDIRRVDYSYDPQKEAEKLAEEKRRKELAEQQKKRLEAEKGAERERLAREKERLEKERLEKEKLEKERLELVQKTELESRPVLWWIEPVFSIGGGPFESGLSNFYRNIQQASNLGVFLASPDSQISLSTNWTYADRASSQLALRAGYDRFIAEIDARSYTAKASFIDVYSYYFPGPPFEINESRTNFVNMDRLDEVHFSLRVGWQFWKSDHKVLTIYSGSRYLSAKTNYFFVGNGKLDPFYAYSSTGAGNDLSMKGAGSDLALEYSQRLGTSPFTVTGRITAFQMNLTAKLQEYRNQTNDFGDIYEFLNWFENSYRYSGRSISLQGDYRLSFGTQLFLELYSMRSDSTVKGTGLRFLLLKDPYLGIQQGELPEVTLASQLALAFFEKKKKNFETVQTISYGVRHRFEFR